MSRMTDKEMLMLAYGALKASALPTKEVIAIVEDHLWPKPEFVYPFDGILGPSIVPGTFPTVGPNKIKDGQVK